jgi:hypothetical protein
MAVNRHYDLSVSGEDILPVSVVAGRRRHGHRSYRGSTQELRRLPWA